MQLVRCRMYAEASKQFILSGYKASEEKFVISSSEQFPDVYDEKVPTRRGQPRGGEYFAQVSYVVCRLCLEYVYNSVLTLRFALQTQNGARKHVSAPFV